MVIDIPMMWTYLAQIIVPLLIGGSMSWSTLPVVLRPYLEESCCAKLIADILLLAKERTVSYMNFFFFNYFSYVKNKPVVPLL